jgi:hypothetical protein
MAINIIDNKNFSRDLWLIMGSWLVMIAFFLSNNYLFSFLDLDEFEIKSWTTIALFLTAVFCFIYSILQSKKQQTNQEE